ncbi:MAG: hypothetical protein AAB578_06050, partial [Elusimicrobiota bacterium]
ESASWGKVVVFATSSWQGLFTGLGPPDGYGDWRTDKFYHVAVRARDRARTSTGTVVGNVSNYGAPGVDIVDFIVDGTPPSSDVTRPAANSFIQNLTVISGTSNSDLAQYSTYYLFVTTRAGTSPPVYWGGSGWTMTPVPLPVKLTGSTGTLLWEYPGGLSGHSAPTVVEADGTQYGLCFQAKDKAGNLEAGTTVYVTKDIIGPQVVISTPGGLQYAKSQQTLPTLSGTSFDTPAGVGRVEVRLTQKQPGSGGDGKIWWNTGWSVAGSSWHVVNSTDNWTFSGPPGSSMTWVDNKMVTIEVQAYDTAGNLAVGQQRDLIYDAVKPTATILVPTNGSFYGFGLPAGLSGQAFDFVPSLSTHTEMKSNLRKVEIAILQGTDYYQGTQALGFTAAVNYRPAQMAGDPAATVNWTWPTGGDQIPVWQHGLTYIVRARAVDKSGNVTGPETENNFTYDAEAPTTTLNAPYNGEYLVAFSSTSGPYQEPDPPTESGLVSLQVAIQERVLNKFWDGTAFSDFSGAVGGVGSWRPADIHVAGSSWSFKDSGLAAKFALETIPRTYSFYVRGVDATGNQNRLVAVNPTDMDASGVKVDFFAPVSSTTLPVEGSLIQGAVTPIVGTADDQSGFGTKGVGMKQIMLKALRWNSAGTKRYWNGSDWNSATDTDFILPTTMGGGAQTVVNFQSQAGGLPEAAFEDGYRYQMVARGEDLLNKRETTVTPRTFTVDRS